MQATASSAEYFLLQVILQLVVIITAARIGGWVFARLGQPLVVGEIITGLMLGPSCLGRMNPQLFNALFPAETSPVFLVLGQIGLIFLMFFVGLEFEFVRLKTLGRAASSVALSGMIVPFLLGGLMAWSIHSSVAPHISRPGFILFMATAMSITAIPILGRIMMELRITRTEIGVLTISAAAVDDALGWMLLAAVSAAVHESFDLMPVLRMLGMTSLFVVTLVLIVRPLALRWIRSALGNAPSHLSLMQLSVVLIGVLLSAATSNLIGVFSIFGPFILGASLCDQKQFQKAVGVQSEGFITAFFLPVFFTYTGLRTNVRTLDSSSLWLICGLVILTAVVGKTAGCGFAARLNGMSWRDSARVAIMMNTRALMGLIAVNIGRDLGVIPESVFCMMVLMAITTTLMTAPALRRLLPAVR